MIFIFVSFALLYNKDITCSLLLFLYKLETHREYVVYASWDIGRELEKRLIILSPSLVPSFCVLSPLTPGLDWACFEHPQLGASLVTSSGARDPLLFPRLILPL